jgi:hypothetical protein
MGHQRDLVVVLVFLLVAARDLLQLLGHDEAGVGQRLERHVLA